MELQPSDIRKKYKKDKLIHDITSESPFEQLICWLNGALYYSGDEPTAMIVATIVLDDRPSTCTVLLKGVEDGGFIFYTNYKSHKGQQLADNPYIPLSLVWHRLERQIRIKDKAEKYPPRDSDVYFSTRPYEGKISAKISPQSRIVNDQTGITHAFVKEATKLTGQRIQRPGSQGGFVVTPTCSEFW